MIESNLLPKNRAVFTDGVKTFIIKLKSWKTKREQRHG